MQSLRGWRFVCAGTEAGVAPDPNWSTGYNKGGNPESDMFNPGESDTTLQNVQPPPFPCCALASP